MDDHAAVAHLWRQQRLTFGFRGWKDHCVAPGCDREAGGGLRCHARSVRSQWRSQADARERRPSRTAQALPSRRLLVQGSGRRQRAGLCNQAAAVSDRKEISGVVPDSRRPPGRVARSVARPLELRAVRIAGIWDRRNQSARIIRLRPEIHRPDQQRLGRKSLHRSDERSRCCPRPQQLARLDAHGCRRRIVRRLHDELDRRPLEPLQGSVYARGRLQSREHVRRDRRDLVQ